MPALGEDGRTATLDRLFRRALLLASGEASQQEIADLAEMAFLAGRNDLVRLFLACIGLELGFGNQGRLWWTATGLEGGFWSIKEAAITEVEEGHQFPILVAMTELRDLMLIKPGVTEQADWQLQTPPVPSVPALIKWSRRLSDALDRLLGDGAFEVSRFLDALQPEASAWPCFDLSGHAGGTIETLSLAIVFNNVRRFAARAECFRQAPFGSDRLLEAAMRLSDNGLGVLLGNVDTLVREERDIFDWTITAAPKGMSAEQIDSWRFLLGTQLRGHRWDCFVSEVVRLGCSELTSLLLKHLLEQAAPGDYKLHHLRDCCLEQGLAEIAFVAQRGITQQRPNDLNELVILADFAGLMNLSDQADSLLRQCLKNHPEDAGLLARRNELAAGTLGAYIRRHGFFGDPVDGPARLTAFRIIPASSEAISQ